MRVIAEQKCGNYSAATSETTSSGTELKSADVTCETLQCAAGDLTIHRIQGGEM